MRWTRESKLTTEMHELPPSERRFMANAVIFSGVLGAALAPVVFWMERSPRSVQTAIWLFAIGMAGILGGRWFLRRSCDDDEDEA